MNDKVVIFGAGHHGRAAFRKCRENKRFNCVCFIDSDKKKDNTSILKKKIYHVNKINKINFDKIIFCGRYIEEQLEQVKKYNIKKNRFLIWGRSKISPPKKKLMQREKILLKMLAYVVNKFNQNKIIYWVDYSGLLGLIRKQHLAEFSDVDISIKLNDVEKVRKIIKSNKKIFSFHTKFISNTKKNKAPNSLHSFHTKFISNTKKNKAIKKITLMSMVGNVNPVRIEPPLIDFVIKKTTPKYVLDLRTDAISAKKHWRSFDVVKYKGLNLNVPNYPEKYLKHLYGKSWKKKMEFWSWKQKI